MKQSDNIVNDSKIGCMVEGLYCGVLNSAILPILASLHA